jgi:hypothetical protein
MVLEWSKWARLYSVTSHFILWHREPHILNILNPWIMEQKKLPTCTELGTFCTHIFKITFATFFFFCMFRLMDSIEVKMVLLFRFLNFHSIIYSEIDKNFEDKKIYFTALVMGANIM